MSKTPTEGNPTWTVPCSRRSATTAGRPGRCWRSAGTSRRNSSRHRATGTYGSIRATFNHLVLSDGRYLPRLAGGAPAWVDRPDDADLDELAARAEEAGQLWERLLAEPVDTERVFVIDDGALEVRAGVIVAQALHHGNAHREQICAS